MKDGFDEKLKKEIKRETKYIQPSSFLKNKINQEIIRRQEENEMKKKFGLKKWAVVAAVICLMVPTTIFAMGKISSYVTHTSLQGENYSKDWEDVAKLKKKAKIKTDVIEQFSNGYVFEDVSLSAMDAQDEEGNKLFTVDELFLSYKKEGEPKISFAVHETDERIKKADEQAQAEANRTPTKTAQYDGIEVSLYEDTYKFVPPDYEETEEDLRMIEEGNLVISYGSSEVSVEKCYSVNWEKDGNSYNLLGFDLMMTEDEILDMAGEIIQQ